jgi:hypothetical protein
MTHRTLGRSFAIGIAAIGWSACAVVAPAVTVAAVECHAPAGTSALWERDDLRFLIVGEHHGTAETPAVFGEIVCDALAAGKTVVVGLEHLEEDADVFAAFLASDGDADALRRFLADVDWAESAERFPDGRTSEAMFRLLQRLRDLRAAGLPLSVAPFIRAPTQNTGSQGPYEEGLAASLMEASSEGAVTIVLVGNIHAMKVDTSVLGGSSSFAPMASHLPAESTLSLFAMPSTGEAWACGRDSCGVRSAGWGGKAERVVELGVVTPVAGFDGVLHVGAVTASPPLLSADQLEAR